MLSMKSQLELRASLLLVCLAILGAARPERSLAQGLDSPPGTARLDSSSSEKPSPLSEVVQVGARLFGKGSRNEAPAKELQEADPKGTSSTSAKKTALAAIPMDQLTPENRQRVSELLKAASFYRRLPKVTFAIEPEVYSYFVAHPDVAVSIWRAMKISKLQMWQTGRYNYEADAGDGSTGKLDVLFTGAEKHLVACDGEYKSPLFTKPIEAQSLLLLQTSFFREADGTIYVTHKADLFVAFPSQTVDVVSKIFSPLTVAMTDRTFSEVSLFLKMMSLAMARRPDWVEEIVGRMEGVADVRKSQILELTTQVHTAAQKRAVERMAESDGTSSGARLSGPESFVPVGSGGDEGASLSPVAGGSETSRNSSREKRPADRR
ncbi:MAG: hypothetical protein ACKV0T_25440 [Planctomycetales bacterium]